MTERALNFHVNATPLFCFFLPPSSGYVTSLFVTTKPPRTRRGKELSENSDGGLMKGESKYIRMRLDIRQGDVASGGTDATAV